MRRDTLIQLLALACMACFLAGSVFMTTRVSASAGRNRLVYADAAVMGDSPEIAAGIAMGAFRGVFVNFLWMRANTLKEEGKYYEAVDLAKTITRLQPRFPRVWAFHAWNLAYNISVATQTQQERWKWVDAGIRLLRDQGIPANNSDILLHKELAWIFLHKIDGYMDDAHRYYKKALAYEWSIVLGKPPVMPLGYHDAAAAQEAYVEKWLKPIADAPASLEELYEKEPLARELAERIQKEAGVDLDFRLLEYIDMLANAQLRASAIGGIPNIGDDPLVKIMSEEKYRLTGRELVRFVRRKLLTETYKMEPDRMIRYTQDFGPLDWRHAAAHALYWSRRGVEESLRRVNEQNKRDFDFVNTDRIVVQSLQALFRSGMIFFDTANPDFYMAMVNPDFLDSYEKYRDEVVSRAGVFEQPGRQRTEYREGLENFYRDAIRYLYRRGDLKRAEQYYTKLRTAPWLNDNTDKRAIYGRTLADFVNHEITDENRFESPPVALQEINGAFEAAFVEGLLGGNTPVFQSNMEYARLFYDKYQQTQKFQVWVAGKEGRMGFPPFYILASNVLARLIIAADVPQGPAMFRRAPDELRPRTWVLLEEFGYPARFAEAEKQGQPGFKVWFPEPSGVAAAREEFQREADRVKQPAGQTELK
ncbi:MAG: hypothetical protein IT438_11345 [Phycisphaerales bacterium]|nr:hypothetical protein [Phycisphaerales bacterium]